MNEKVLVNLQLSMDDWLRLQRIFMEHASLTFADIEVFKKITQSATFEFDDPFGLNALPM